MWQKRNSTPRSWCCQVNDELRNILGDRMFEELSTLGDEFEEHRLDGIPVDAMDVIADMRLNATVSMSGTEALTLVAAFVHLLETGCDGCRTHVEDFTMSFITTLWEMVQQTFDHLENDDE